MSLELIKQYQEKLKSDSEEVTQATLLEALSQQTEDKIAAQDDSEQNQLNELEADEKTDREEMIKQLQESVMGIDATEDQIIRLAELLKEQEAEQEVLKQQLVETQDSYKQLKKEVAAANAQLKEGIKADQTTVEKFIALAEQITAIIAKGLKGEYVDLDSTTTQSYSAAHIKVLPGKSKEASYSTKTVNGLPQFDYETTYEAVIPTDDSSVSYSYAYLPAVKNQENAQYLASLFKGLEDADYGGHSNATYSYSDGYSIKQADTTTYIASLLKEPEDAGYDQNDKGSYAYPYEHPVRGEDQTQYLVSLMAELKDAGYDPNDNATIKALFDLNLNVSGDWGINTKDDLNNVLENIATSNQLTLVAQYLSPAVEVFDRMALDEDLNTIYGQYYKKHFEAAVSKTAITFGVSERDAYEAFFKTYGEDLAVKTTSFEDYEKLLNDLVQKAQNMEYEHFNNSYKQLMDISPSDENYTARMLASLNKIEQIFEDMAVRHGITVDEVYNAALSAHGITQKSDLENVAKDIELKAVEAMYSNLTNLDPSVSGYDTQALAEHAKIENTITEIAEKYNISEDDAYEASLSEYGIKTKADLQNAAKDIELKAVAAMYQDLLSFDPSCIDYNMQVLGECEEIEGDIAEIAEKYGISEDEAYEAALSGYGITDRASYDKKSKEMLYDMNIKNIISALNDFQTVVNETQYSQEELDHLKAANKALEGPHGKRLQRAGVKPETAAKLSKLKADFIKAFASWVDPEIPEEVTLQDVEMELQRVAQDAIGQINLAQENKRKLAP